MLFTLPTAPPAAATTVTALAPATRGLPPSPPDGLPAHVFSPYFETYAGDNLAATVRASGARYVSLAFLQTPRPGSCELDWDGQPTAPLTATSYTAAISQAQRDGTGVVASFGGYGADHTGTDIADSCHDVGRTAAAYESAVTAYGITRLDLDIEDKSLGDGAGIKRRNQAVHEVEQWAAAHHRPVQFTYTVPGYVNGPSTDEVNVLTNAEAEGAQVSVVNLMTFDFAPGSTQDMALDTEQAATNLVRVLAQLHPTSTTAQVWAMVGITEMIGVDDTGPRQTFTLADARTVRSWAAKQGVGELSFWALQRDNDGCPGRRQALGNCSGVNQRAWAFSRELEPFGQPGPS